VSIAYLHPHDPQEHVFDLMCLPTVMHEKKVGAKQVIFLLCESSPLEFWSTPGGSRNKIVLAHRDRFCKARILFGVDIPKWTPPPKPSAPT